MRDGLRKRSDGPFLVVVVVVDVLYKLEASLNGPKAQLSP